MIHANAAAPGHVPKGERRPGMIALSLAAGLAVSAVGSAAAAAATGGIHDLASCQRLAETAPAAAIVESQTWIEHGGGEEARACRAEAQFQVGDFAAAGRSFEDLAAASVGRGPRQVANLYDRAAWAWLRSGDTARAERLYTVALDKVPDDNEVRVDRGIARAEGRRYREAIEDFTAALKRQPRRADAYFYRAAAYRALSDLKNAEADVEQALRLKPGDGDALVLRGTVRALHGDTTGARLDWRDVVRREPDSASGKAAAANLARLNDAPAPKTPSGGPR